jgi:hypothetical protein
MARSRFFTLSFRVESVDTASIHNMGAALIVEPMPQYPKLLELYCFGCMGPIAVSPRPEVLRIVERLHRCRFQPDLSSAPDQGTQSH